MKQIDQDPRDYRAKPVKGEPVFAPGAGPRIAIGIVVLLVGIGAAVVTSPLQGIGYWISCQFITGTCVSSVPAPAQ